MPDEVGLLATIVSAVGQGLTATSLDQPCRDAVVTLSAGDAAVDGVAVTLSSQLGVRAVIGGSNENSRWLEHVQLSFGEGPCTEATTTRRPVIVHDLADPTETRWPMVARMLAERPIRAVTAVPLTIGRSAVGSMNVHSEQPHGLASLDLTSVMWIGQVLTIAVLALRARDPAETGAGLPDVIPQATGMVIAALRLGPADALDRLRGVAFLQGRLLTDVARDIVDGRMAPDLATAGPGAMADSS